VIKSSGKVCFGETQKPTREARAHLQEFAAAIILIPPRFVANSRLRIRD